MADDAMQLPAEDHGQEHLTEATYIRIAIILAIITTIEVAIYYVDWFHTSGTLVPLLAIFSLIKFITVIAYFMHLKVDDKRYRYTFLCGLVLGVAIVTALVALLKTHQIEYGLRLISGADH